jgi:hypothetical protein
MSLKKTIFSISVSFFFAFTIFFLIVSALPDYTFMQHENFYSQTLDPKKIFIFGSSQVFAINPTIISEILSNIGYDHTVYHLGQGSFDAEERLRTSALITSQKPDVVLYGISYQTFYSYGRTIVEKPDDSFISPPRILDSLSFISLPVNDGLLDNPKFAVITTINHLSRTLSSDVNEKPIRPYENTPFFIDNFSTRQPANPSEFEIDGSLVNYKGNEIYPINKNRTFDALKQLIHELHDNDVEVIIFTTPHNKNWLNQLPIQQKEIFESMLNDLEGEFNFKVHRLHDKVDSMEIWVDHDHLISHSSETDFYSEEVAKMILNRIDEK